MRHYRSANSPRNRFSCLAYGKLEPRRVLATAVSFSTGTLDLGLSAANDVAIVDVDGNGNVIVNGSDQINVNGSASTVAAELVTGLSSRGTEAFGQQLNLVGDLPFLDNAYTSSIDLISIEGSYNLDSLDIDNATTVSQLASSTLTVAANTEVDAIGNISMVSATNNFGGVFSATGTNISVRDIDSITLGSIAASGNLDVEAFRIDSLLSPVRAEGNISLNVIEGATFDQTFVEAADLTVIATKDYSNVSFGNLLVGGDLYIEAGLTSGNSTWTVSGDTTINAISLRDVRGDAVSLQAVDLATDNYTVSAPFGSIVLGDATVAGNADISALRITVEQDAPGDDIPFGAASSNQGGATISVNGNTVVAVAGFFDAEDATLNSDNLTIRAQYSNVVLGTATTVVGNLKVTAGGNVDAGSVTVGGYANIRSDRDITVNLATDGNSDLYAGENIILAGLTGESVTLQAENAISNLTDATIAIQENLMIQAGSAALGNMAGDSLIASRLTANVENDLVIDQQSNVRLLNVNAGSLSVKSTGSITNRNDASIYVIGDAEFSGRTITIGNTASDTFNAQRIRFNAINTAIVSENSDTRFFGESSARILDIESSGDVTDDPNAMTDIAFSSLFAAKNVALGDSPTDSFSTRTLTFNATGHVDVSQDSRIFLAGGNVSDRLTLTTSISLLDSPTTTVNVTGEISFNTPYLKLGDNATDQFNAGSVSFNSSDTVNLIEDSDTVFSNNSDVRLAIVESIGSMSNAVGASFDVTSGMLTAKDEIYLGVQSGDFIDIDRLQFSSAAGVTIDHDDSLYFYGNNAADSLFLIAEGAIGDSGTASFQINGSSRLQGTSIWIGEKSTDSFVTGTLNFQATGGVIIEQDSPLLLRGNNSAFNLTLSSSDSIEDDDAAQTVVQKFASFTANRVSIGDSANDCFHLVDGPTSFEVIAITSNVVVNC